MYCHNQLSYVIRQGDNLYHLARHYHTTVPAILSQNPNIDPYNLQIGTSLIICPGEEFLMKSNNAYPMPSPDPEKYVSLINDMRAVWEQHVYWTRMLLISIAERLKDQSDTANRILENPKDIANIFAKYYPMDIAKKIAQLLTEHLQIGSALITALRDGKTAEADKLNRQWYINADKMADTFSSINPYYSREALREMLYNHLGLTTQEVSLRLAGKYGADIEAFNKVEEEALKMADYFSSGLIKQFPQNFS